MLAPPSHVPRTFQGHTQIWSLPRLLNLFIKNLARSKVAFYRDRWRQDRIASPAQGVLQAEVRLSEVPSGELSLAGAPFAPAQKTHCDRSATGSSAARIDPALHSVRARRFDRQPAVGVGLGSDRRNPSRETPYATTRFLTNRPVNRSLQQRR
jgi:hypothetical protein